jgi:glycosyltransferase involved in cell wall biosynthesis
MKALLFANTDWYLYNFRLPMAKAMRNIGMQVVFISPPGSYVEKIQAEGFRWLAIPLSQRSVNPFREITTLVSLIRAYRLERPDLVHHFTIKCMLYGSLAGRLCRIPSIVNSVTGLGYAFSGTSLSRRVLQALVKALYRLCLRGTRFIFQNESDRQVFLDGRMAQADTGHMVRGSGVDTALFTPGPEPQGTPVVMLAARLLWEKGVGEFVAAARLLKEQGMSARFVLVGAPYPENPSSIPQQQLDAWQAEGIVELWGWRENMPEVYRQASVFCLPSSYREGLSKTLIEAAACGRPLITTDIPGCRDVVRNGINGLLIKAQDAPGLAQAIASLLADKALRQRMGQAGRKMIEENFSIDKIIAETLEVYRTAGLRI